MIITQYNGTVHNVASLFKVGSIAMVTGDKSIAHNLKHLHVLVNQ